MRQQVALHGKDNRISGVDPIPPGRWEFEGTADPFLNGWTNAGGGMQEFRWRRTNENQTEIQGFVQGGTAQPVINLSDPYRPAAVQYAVGSDSAGGLIVWVFEPSGDLSFFDAAYVGPASAGNGLGESGGVLSVNVDGSTLEISADTLRVKDGGITEASISLSDVTADNVTSTAHGFAPKSPADSTKFLDGSATPAWDTVKDSDLSTSDITTNDVSTSKHGFAPKAPGNSALYLDGNGDYSSPAGADPGSGGLARIYDYIVSGSDKADIDSAVDGTTVANFAGYDVLEFWIVARTDEAITRSAVVITLNNDSGANYDIEQMRALGSTVVSAGAVALSNWTIECPGASASANYAATIRGTIPDYTQNVFYKTFELTCGYNHATAGSNFVSHYVGSWRNTSDVTRIKVAAQGASNLKVGSRLVIYGR